MAKKGALTAQQRRFVAAYQGNATEAAIAAGYAKSGAHVQGNRLLNNANVRTAIKQREARDARPLIASREERQERLTKIIRSAAEETRDRIKAIEILGKMSGDFLERVEHSGALAIRWAKPEEAANDG